MSLPNTTHPNSKKVTIFRKPGATQEQSDLKEYYALTYKALGSYFQAGGSQKSSSGLEYWEENVIMPLLIDVTAEDKEFRSKVASFNDDLNTAIPYHEGKTLEIGLLKDNAGAVTEDNMPLNPIDYVRYRHALRHPECAGSKEEAMGNMLVDFYIHDTARESNTAFSELEEQDIALTEYLTLKSDTHKVEMHLSLLGRDPRNVPTKEQLGMLKKAIETRAADFVANVKDKDNEERYFINQLLAARIMELVGSAYLIKETSEVLGYTTQEVVIFLQNKANSALKGVLKAQLQEVRKPKKGKTVPEVA